VQHQSTNSPEEWRPVVGYEGWYEASNHGRIRRVCPGRSTHSGFILTPRSAGNRYGGVKVRLHKDDGGKQFSVSRLVALAFLPGVKGKEVNHRDGDRENNKLSNLEWVTASENIQHSVDILGTHRGFDDTKGERNPHSKLTNQDIFNIRAQRGKMTYREIAKWFGVGRWAVGDIINRRGWQHI